MNPTVMTTGPGVIMATATASTNWRSVSQWCSLTTPPYRNGTIASPLPNTKAPASAKNMPICHKTVQSVVAASGTAVGNCAANASIPGVPPLPNHFFGGALTIQTSSPAARNRVTNSDSVTTVITAATRYIAHNNVSLPMLLVASLYALL